VHFTGSGSTVMVYFNYASTKLSRLQLTNNEKHAAVISFLLVVDTANKSSPPMTKKYIISNKIKTGLL
jgi:hypothetical protein